MLEIPQIVSRQQAPDVVLLWNEEIGNECQNSMFFIPSHRGMKQYSQALARISKKTLIPLSFSVCQSRERTIPND